MTYRYRVELLQEILAALCARSNGVEQAVIVSLEGFVVASYPPTADLAVHSPLHSPKIAATAANAVSLGEGALNRLEHGQLMRLIIEGEHGAMIIYPIAGQEAALVGMVDRNAKLGLASSAMRRSIQELASILSGGNDSLS